MLKYLGDVYKLDYPLNVIDKHFLVNGLATAIAVLSPPLKQSVDA